MTLTSIQVHKRSMDIIIDRIALWRAKINDNFTIRTSSVGTPYKKKDGSSAIADKPIYRYAKCYTVKDGNAELKFSLFARTFSTDAAKAEKTLDAVAKTITPAQAREVIANPTYAAFVYLNEYMEA